MTEEANVRTCKVISLACGSREAAALFSKLHEEMLLEIESKVRAVGHGPANVVQGDCLELPAAPSDVRSRSNKRVVGSYESRAKVTFLRQCAMCLSSRAAFKGRNDGVNCRNESSANQLLEGTEKPLVFSTLQRTMKQSLQLMAGLVLPCYHRRRK